MPLTVNTFPNELAPNVPNNIPKSPPLCSFASFLIVFANAFYHKTDSSKDLIMSVIPFISSLEIINIVIPDPKTFFWIAVCVADGVS